MTTVAKVLFVRFVVAATLLDLLSLQFSERVATALFPFFKAEILRLDDTYSLERMFADRRGADEMICVDVRLAHSLVINGLTFHPDPRGTARACTVMADMVLGPLLTAAIALACPVRRKLAYAWRVLALIPLVVLLWAIDVPIVLWAYLWGIHVQAVQPDRFSPIIIWTNFLNSGGRLVLAVTAGIVAGHIGALHRKSWLQHDEGM